MTQRLDLDAMFLSSVLGLVFLRSGYTVQTPHLFRGWHHLYAENKEGQRFLVDLKVIPAEREALDFATRALHHKRRAKAVGTHRVHTVYFKTGSNEIFTDAALADALTDDSRLKVTAV